MFFDMRCFRVHHTIRCFESTFACPGTAEREGLYEETRHVESNWESGTGMQTKPYHPITIGS